MDNARKAREDLDKAMGAFDSKMANIGEEAKKGRSQLASQAAAQDKQLTSCSCPVSLRSRAKSSTLV